MFPPPDLLDGLLVVLVLLAVEDLDAALLGSGTTRQAAGQRQAGDVSVWPRAAPAWARVGAVPPVGRVVSGDVSRSVAARCGTPEAQTAGAALSGGMENTEGTNGRGLT